MGSRLGAPFKPPSASRLMVSRGKGGPLIGPPLSRKPFASRAAYDESSSQAAALSGVGFREKIER